MIKRLWCFAAVRAAVMIIFSMLFMQTMNVIRRPNVDSIVALLLSLPEYNNMTETVPQGAYIALSDMQIKNIRIFVSEAESCLLYTSCIHIIKADCAMRVNIHQSGQQHKPCAVCNICAVGRFTETPVLYRNIHNAVSYTHLDVYKRQVQDS